MTQVFALALALRLATVGLVLEAVESLVARRALTDSGLLSWPIGGQLRSPRLAGPSADKLLSPLLRYPNILFVIALRIPVGALAFIVPDRFLAYPMTALLLSHLAMVARSGFGGDGSDQMTTLILLPGTVALWLNTRAVTYALWFIAAQLTLSYVTAGIAKLRGKRWRNGTGLIGITSTTVYGYPRIAHTLATHPYVSIALSWLIICWEITFPIVFVAPHEVALSVLAVGLLFHLANAVILGLNGFLWSFGAAYPIILALTIWPK